MMNLLSQFGDLSQISSGAAAGLLIGGLLNCFLGYRLMRVWMGLIGFLIGAVGGFLITTVLGTDQQMLPVVAAVVAGVIFAVLAFSIYKLGVFVLCLTAVTLILCMVFRPNSSLTFFLCMLAGAAVGSLGVMCIRPVVIISTCIQGGIAIGLAVAANAGVGMGALAGAGAGAAGAVVQFLTTRKKQDEDDEEDEKDGKRDKN